MPKEVLLHNKRFVQIISSRKIQSTITGIAKKINKDFSGERPIFISLLNGAFMFTGDLIKRINTDCEVSFIKVASYSGKNSTGKVKQLIGLHENLRGRNIIIVDDIIDSGNTIHQVLHQLKKSKPASIKIATLFFKPEVFKKSFKIDYAGMNIANDFIVGYGLDYNGLGRNLTDIYKLKS